MKLKKVKAMSLDVPPRSPLGVIALTPYKLTAALSEPPLLLDPLNPDHMPLVHFLAVASHCMPAFLQAASVFGAPANAGAVKATTRLKARIDTSAFIDCLLR